MRKTAKTAAHPVEQYRTAYKRMAADAHYRPAAPSDGFGTITAEVGDLDLEAEAATYAADWWRRGEDHGLKFVGVPTYENRAAYAFAVEATRLLCAGNTQVAARLLQMSLDETERHGGAGR